MALFLLFVSGAVIARVMTQSKYKNQGMENNFCALRNKKLALRQRLDVLFKSLRISFASIFTKRESVAKWPDT